MGNRYLHLTYGALVTKIEDYGEVEVPGLLLEAAGGAPRPGILLLQEIFGVNASIRATAESFRDRGYDVFVPDLFWRQAPGIDLDPASADDRSKAEALMKGLDERVAIADIGMGARRLRRLGRGSGRIAAVGYWLGGPAGVSRGRCRSRRCRGVLLRRCYPPLARSCGQD